MFNVGDYSENKQGYRSVVLCDREIQDLTW